MPRRSNPNGTRALLAVMELAHDYRKQHPRVKWTEAVKKAGEKYRKRKLGK